jgi:Sulfatase
VFAGDNGPEDVVLWRGTPGYWEGSYFAGGEGNLRTPCIVRWPGHVAEDRVSDEIMHVTDWFTTILHAAGLSEPTDRVIDGVNQLRWLAGSQDASAREGYIFWMGPEMYGVKWRNFKLVLVEQKYSNDPAGRLSAPRIINLVTDPQEREAIAIPYLHSSTAFHFNRILSEFTAGTQREPPIAASAPLEFVPAAAHRQAVARIADQRAAQPAWSHSRLAAGRGCRHAVSPERQLRRRDLRWRGPAAATHHDPEGRLPCGHESRPRR